MIFWIFFFLLFGFAGGLALVFWSGAILLVLMSPFIAIGFVRGFRSQRQRKRDRRDRRALERYQNRQMAKASVR